MDKNNPLLCGWVTNTGHFIEIGAYVKPKTYEDPRLNPENQSRFSALITAGWRFEVYYA